MLRISTLLIALAGTVLAASSWAQETVRSAALSAIGQSVGTHEHRTAAWMAILADGNGTQFLVGAGDPIFENGEPRPIGMAKKVSPVDLLVSPSRGDSPRRVFPGRPVPGARGLTLRDVVAVRHIEYRHRVVSRGAQKILSGELYLVGLDGTLAVLQRDVEAASPTLASEQRLAAIPLTRIAPRTWEIRAVDLKGAVESGEDILKHAVRDTALDVSLDRGVGVDVKTPIADVRLDRRGFLVTSPNMASRAGLEVGDRILAVNAMPIQGTSDLVRMYRHLKNDPAVTRVDLTIERQNTPQTLTYRVR